MVASADVMEVDAGFPSAENLGGLLEFETLISDLSARFILLPPDAVDREIEVALGRVCRVIRVDLAVLWQWSVADPTLIEPTHVYYAQEGPRPSEPMRQEHYPWSRAQVLAGRAFSMSAPEDLPAEAAVDRETCRSLGIKSALCLPLLVGGDAHIGALGFNSLQEHRAWPDALVRRLQLVAEVFTNALVRRNQQRSLQESEARLAAGAELAGLGFYEVDFDRGLMYSDDRLRDVCGVPPDRIHGLAVLEFWLERLHPDDRQQVLELRRQLHDGELTRLSTEYRYLHPQHGEVWMQHVAGVGSRDGTGRAVTTYGVLRDVTERKHAQEDLRDLGQRLIRAHEEERALLARELHDDLTQRLAVLAIDVGRTERTAADPAQAEALRSVREALVRISEDVHALAYQLHPSVLEELGLSEALRVECERFRQKFGIDLSMDLVAPPAGVGKDAALCLFRVAQESLNNVARHAEATAASVTLRMVNDAVRLVIRDDGRGFDPAAARGRRSLGLASMRERVRLMNGSFEIESAPGRGTAVVARVPLTEAKR